MKIFITGYYGQNNFGDDLFQKLFKEYLKSQLEDVTINNFSPVNKGKFNRINRVLNMIYNIIRSDYIIYAGGSILSDTSSNNMRKLQYLLVKILKKKHAVYGVSYGPFTDKKLRKFYDKFIKSLSFVALRDKESYRKVLDIENINSENIYFSGDIATLITNKELPKPDKNKKVLGISLCNYDRYTSVSYDEEERFLNQFTDDIQKQMDQYEEVIIFALKTGDLGDEKLAKMQFDKYSRYHNKVSIIYHIDDVTKTLSYMNLCTHLICMRLHAMIPSIILNKTVLSIEYHEKCKHFLDTINAPDKLRISRDEYTLKDFTQKLINLNKSEPISNNKLVEYQNAHNIIIEDLRKETGD